MFNCITFSQSDERKRQISPVKVSLYKVVYLLFSLGMEVLELVHGTAATERNRDHHYHI